MSIASQNERGGQIAGLFVRRPVLAVVINALIIVAGLAALIGIEVRELPSVERPVLTISTQFPGAAAETVDREITSAIEGAVARVQGVVSISSSSSYGSSRVTLSFAEGVNLDNATSDVRDITGRLANRLPDGSNAPVIIKADPDAGAIMQLSVTSDRLDPDELSQLVEDVVVERLAAVQGVADVQVYGTRSKSFEVDIDPVKLASLGLTVADLRNALANVAFDSPAGSINGTNQNINVRAIAEVNTPEQFEEIIINGKTRLRDVATVVFAAGSSSSNLRSDGKPGIGIGIVRQAQSNTVGISQAVHAAVAQMQSSLPPGVDVIVSSDDAVFIGGALHEVERSLMVAIVAVVIIMFLFLWDWRATLIPALTMPVALIGTIAGMYLMGFSINILTLLAIVLATGLVVDDAIVVLENIVRQRHLGLGKRAAAVLGTREVFFAVLATTATLAAVFVPLSFLPGQTGQLFREFGWTLAIAVALSSIVSLSLAPMMAARLLKDTAQRSSNPLAGIGNLLASFYRWSLSLALRNPLIVLFVAVLFAASAVMVFGTLRQELVPPEDRSSINLRISAPQTVSLDFTRTQMQKIEDLLQPLVASGEIIRIFSISGFGSSTSSGNLTLTLAPWDERTRTQQQIAGDISRLVEQVPGVRVSVGGGNSLNIRGGGSGLQFAVVGSDYAQLATAAQAIAAQLEEDPRFGRVNVNYSATQPQLTLVIDREKAAALGIDINGLGPTMQAMIDGADVGTVFIEDASYSVRMVSTVAPVNDPRDLEGIFLRSTDGRYVPMSTIARLSEAPIAPSLSREEQRRSVSVSASLDGLAMGDAWAMTQAIAAPLLPDGAAVVPLAEARTIGEANYGLAITFGFALVVILLVLAAQFESVWSAIIVMATVPFGLACAIYALVVTGQSLNLFTQIGLILVVGIMAKNGILIVEFANQLRDRGLGVAEAIEEASNIRLRPVMMTMIATVIGGLPLVLGTGAGAESRAALGWVIVGGLGFAAISTLYLTPVAYLLIARFSKPKVEEERRLERELAAAEARAEPAE